MDWNNDGRKDLVTGEYTGAPIRVYTNCNTDAEPVFNSYQLVQTGGQDFNEPDNQSSPWVVDWNNDQRKDLLCGSKSGHIYLLLNTNTDANPLFDNWRYITNGSAPLVTGCSYPAVADWDGDGRKDLLVGETVAHVRLYLNQGTDAEPVFNGHTYLEAGGSRIETEIRSRPLPVDWDGDSVLDLLVGDSAGYVRDCHGINPDEPWLTAHNYLVHDGDGNTNCLPNPGEVVRIMVGLTNHHSAAHNVRVTLSSDDPDLELLVTNAWYGNIAGGGYAHNAATPFCVRVSSNAPQTVLYQLRLRIHYDRWPEGREIVPCIGNYTLDDAAPFSWISTTGGTEYWTYWYNNIYHPIGFPFPFYGHVYTQAQITTLGYLAFGTDMRGMYQNETIPYPKEPNGLIAPYWDQLGSSTTQALVRVRTFGVAPERYMVVEWTNMPTVYRPTDRITLQAILYETGDIKFQYGPMDAPSAYGVSATIGIEDRRGVDSILYAYNTANAVSNGQAIMISPWSGSRDADHDGMPDSFEMFYFGTTNIAPDADSDGDGLSNLDEFNSGGAPSARNNALRFRALRRDPTNNLLTWDTVPGLQYSLESCTNLLQRSWTPETNTVVWQHSCTVRVDRASGKYYRLRM